VLNVVVAIPVTAVGLGLSGGDAGNYTVNSTALTTANITPAALTVTANNQSKNFGTTFIFAGTEFSTSGLQGGETVGSATLASPGAPAGATVAGSPYPITVSAATGGTFTLSNYTITYVPGLMTVTQGSIPPGFAFSGLVTQYTLLQQLGITNTARALADCAGNANASGGGALKSVVIGLQGQCVSAGGGGGR
jgi:hypothetical protein